MRFTATIGFFALSLSACSGEVAVDSNEASAAISSANLKSCSGDGCDGLWPDQTTCVSGAHWSVPQGNPDIVKSHDGKDTIELRWSDDCQTNWARAIVASGRRNQVWIERSDGTIEPSAITSDRAHWSPMIYTGPASARAHLCLDPHWYDSGCDEEVVTQWW